MIRGIGRVYAKKLVCAFGDVRLPKTNTFEASKLNSSRHPGRGGVLRDEVVAERKIVYLRNVGQGSSGLEGEACSTLARISHTGSDFRATAASGTTERQRS